MKNRVVQSCRENRCRIRKVWNGDLPTSSDLTYLERLWMIGLLCLRIVSVSEFLKCAIWTKRRASARNHFVEWYAVGKFALLLLAVFVCAEPGRIIACIVGYALLESVAATLYPKFIGDYDKVDPLHSPNRSILLLFLAYGNLVTGFALLYVWTGTVLVGTDPACRNPLYLHDPLDALYFSCVTVTTLGYGDYLPTDGWSKALVVLQTLSGFLLLVLMLAVFVGKPSKNDAKEDSKNAN